MDLFEASGNLKIFDTPGLDAPGGGGGAQSDRSVSELGDGQTDKWNNHQYQEYMEQLKKRHGAGTDSSREELERQALALLEKQR